MSQSHIEDLGASRSAAGEIATAIKEPLRILISTHDFYPGLGGIETAAMTLALGLAKRGYEVTVVTEAPGDSDGFPFKIVRQPSPLELIRLIRSTDLLWQNHISLRLAWPVFIFRRPTVFAHHIWLNVGMVPDLRFGSVKRLACMTGQNVFVSRELKKAARLPGSVIPNSYDSATFHRVPEVPRDRDVAFLGRFVPVKGADILVDAIGLLAEQKLRLNATLIGEGPEDEALKTRASARGISESIDFSGPVRGAPLARLLNRHKFVVVPSRWEEPFGIVALEALACGCVVVVADSGALPDVIGPCGPTVPKDDPPALAAALRSLLSDPSKLRAYRDAIPGHLEQFSEARHIDACEAVIHDTIRSWYRGGRSDTAHRSLEA